jgi:hypothetical protein
MAVRQLAPGASVPAPAGALRVRLDGPQGVQLEIRDEAGGHVTPTHQVSSTEAIIIPGERPRIIGAVSAGQPIPPGSLAGLTISGVSAGDQYVRPQVDIGGRTFAALVRLTETPNPRLSDALEVPLEAHDPFVPRPWHRVGSYAYHAHHDDFSEARVPWAIVVDASAGMLLQSRRAEVGTLIECLIGILGSAMGSAPTGVLTCSSPVPREIKTSVDAEPVDWRVALGDDPSPWSRVTPAVEAAAGGLRNDGLLVLVTNGVPVDLEQLQTWSSKTGRRLIMILLGRSPYECIRALTPVAPWDDELSALGPLAAHPRVTLVSVGSLVAVPGSAVDLADAMFPLARGIR